MPGYGSFDATAVYGSLSSTTCEVPITCKDRNMNCVPSCLTVAVTAGDTGHLLPCQDMPLSLGGTSRILQIDPFWKYLLRCAKSGIKAWPNAWPNSHIIFPFFFEKQNTQLWGASCMLIRPMLMFLMDPLGHRCQGLYCGASPKTKAGLTGCIARRHAQDGGASPCSPFFSFIFFLLNFLYRFVTFVCINYVTIFSVKARVSYLWHENCPTNLSWKNYYKKICVLSYYFLQTKPVSII